jgi:choline dehydrogenase-like flavoprotein
MIIDARLLPDKKEINADVCIVGSGLAGITLAREFMDREFRVCILESGGPKAEPETQSLAWGENVGHPYFSIDTAYARFCGGSISRWMIDAGDHRYGARMRPFDPIDFEERDWVPYSGWPFDKSHLDPFYERAQRICKIDPPSFDLNDWEDPIETPRLRFADDRVKTVVFKFGLRNSFINSHLPEVLKAANITTYLYANVISIETDESARNVTRLHVASSGGTRLSISASLFILATGGIETPRLLLNSKDNQKAGLGNQHDLVGRFFMEHLHFLTGVLVPSTPELFQSTGLYNHIHDINGVSIIGKLALGEAVLRREKLINYAAELVPRVMLQSSLSGLFYPPIASESVHSFRTAGSAVRRGALPEEPGRHLKNMLAGMDDIAVTAYRNMKRKSLRTFSRKKIKAFWLASMSEQTPNPSSRVTLSAERDKFGMNCTKLDWRLQSIDIQSVIRSQEILKEEIHRAGLGRLFVQFKNDTPPQMVTGGWHQMGTTRMHTDPKKGVVDENCRVHGTSNLYISGPSVFPTGGYANPSLTIVALAVRLADHVKSLLS